MSNRFYGGTCRGFKLRYSRRFSVQAFRARFLFIFKILKKWTSAYFQALKFLKKGTRGAQIDGSVEEHHRKIGRMSEMGSSRSMNGLMVADIMPRSHECRMRSLERSNSFYTEAIADCLEFIKRNSVSDEDNKTMSVTTDNGAIEIKQC